MSIPMCKKAQHNFNCFLPYQTVIRFAKGAGNNLAMATPLFTLGRNNVGAKNREYFVDGQRLGKRAMLGCDLLSSRRCERGMTARRGSSERALITCGSAVCKATPTDGQKVTAANISASNSLKAVTREEDKSSSIPTINLIHLKTYNHIYASTPSPACDSRMGCWAATSRTTREPRGNS